MKGKHLQYTQRLFLSPNYLFNTPDYAIFVIEIDEKTNKNLIIILVLTLYQILP